MNDHKSSWDGNSSSIKGIRIEPTAKDATPYFAPAEKEFVKSMQAIAKKWGKLADNDGNGIYVGYVDPAKNENKSIGIVCANCAHYESSGICKIISAKIEPNGYCRLAAIPSEKVKKSTKKD